MGFDEYLSLLEGETFEFLPVIQRSSVSSAGKQWSEISRKVSMLAIQRFLIEGDVNAFNSLLGQNVDAKLLLLNKLADKPDDRFRCSGLYETTLEAMALGLWSKGEEICRLANPEPVLSVEHITDFQYARLLGHTCNLSDGVSAIDLIPDVEVFVEKHLLQEGCIFKVQTHFLLSLLKRAAKESIQYFQLLVQQKVEKNGNSQYSLLRKRCQLALGDLDAEADILLELDDVQYSVDIELLAFAALARRYGVALDLVEYDYCPLDLQKLSLKA